MSDSREVIVFRSGANQSLYATHAPLFEAMEAYITEGVTTEVLAVAGGATHYDAARVWDLHLHNRGETIDPGAVNHALHNIHKQKGASK